MTWKLAVILSALSFAGTASAQMIPTATATPCVTDVFRVGAPGCGCINEFDQPVQPGSFPPDNYPIHEVSSPYGNTMSFTAATGSLIYQMDMPVALSQPYVLGQDFVGNAHICTQLDSMTGQYYDQVTLTNLWAWDSGGLYNLKYQYQPYQVGLGSYGSPVITYGVYAVDGAPRNDKDKKNDCLVAASEEYAPFAIDVQLTPLMYEHDRPVGYGRGAYAGKWKYIDSRNDMINEVNAAHTAKGSRVAVGMNSHGHIDWWRGWAAGGLQANNADVQGFGAAVVDKISVVYFESCCTGKGKTLGNADNILDSLSNALTSWNQTWTRVCGFNHQTSGWFRGGAFHVGMSKGDALVCVH